MYRNRSHVKAVCDAYRDMYTEQISLGYVRGRAVGSRKNARCLVAIPPREGEEGLEQFARVPEDVVKDLSGDGREVEVRCGGVESVGRLACKRQSAQYYRGHCMVLGGAQRIVERAEDPPDAGSSAVRGGGGWLLEGRRLRQQRTARPLPVRG